MAKIYFNYAAMNAGKSAILLQSAHNYEERGMSTLLLKPDIDTRERPEGHIVSRIGLTSQAHVFSASCDLYAHISADERSPNIDCILIDEAQFLTRDQVWQLARVADEYHIPIMCYGLRTDFQGNLFEGSAALLGIADSVREIKTLCWCARKATMTLRVSEDGVPARKGAQVEIGGNDRYVSLCRHHWVQGITEGPT